MIEAIRPNQDNLKGLLENPTWWKTLSLAERISDLLAQPSQAATPGQFSQSARRRIQRWKEQAPFERDNYLADRLSQVGISEAQFDQLLADSAQTVQSRHPARPGWLNELAVAFAEFEVEGFRPYPPTPDVAEPVILLLEAIRPLVQRGLRRLRQGVDSLASNYAAVPFSPDNLEGLLFTNLAPQLAFRLSQTLALEINVARLSGNLDGLDAQERFRNWLQRLGRQGRIVSIFEEYPVLASQLLIIIDNWVKTNLEFLERLCADWSGIQTTFTAGEEPGVLVEVDGGAGDAHRGGRSVLKLKFSSGFRLVYKPKSLSIDVHFQQLLRWLNERGDHLPFPILKLINRGTYGWSEFVKAEGCSDLAGIRRFYERQGGYLALLYALEATDFHYENLIASGENPVLIDLEALFHPHTEDANLSQSDFMAASLVGYSVLRVGLLPRRSWSTDKSDGVDLSGLNGKGGQLTPRPVPRWQDWGTDQMRMVREHVEIPHSQNRPKLIQGENLQEVEVLDFKMQIALGFSKIYGLLKEYQQELLAGPLAEFAHDEIRIVLRATNTYAKLLHESFHPDMLRDALERDRFFDHLWLPVVRMPYLSRVIQAEQAALLTGDIPMFTTRPDIRDIYGTQGQPITQFFEEPSMEIVRRRIAQLNEKDLSLQLWFIEASFATVPLGAAEATWKPSRLEPSRTSVTRQRLLNEAKAVGDKLESLAVQVDNDASWVGLSLLSQRQWVLLPAGADLYSGITGIALFLSYLGAVTAEERYTRLAKYALVSIRRQVEQFKDLKISTGAFEGWGAPVYLLSHLGALWSDKGLLEEAASLIENLDNQIHLDNKNVDIIGGSAGAILGLLSHYQVSRSARSLEVASNCGDHLIESASKMPRGIGWVSHLSGEKPLTGFSHGAAGIAYSLLQLYQATGEERFRQTALAAMEYERSLFSVKEQNWPDLRPDELIGLRRSNEGQAEQPLSYMATWCHGAPGVGLGRAASFNQLPGDAYISEEIEAAATTTLEKGFGMNHSLCHGDLGNIEVLLTAASALNRPDFKDKADTITAMVLDSIEKYGWLTGIPMGVTSPGLMTGIAGIGYGLLRLVEPETVPSILLVAPPR